MDLSSFNFQQAPAGEPAPIPPPNPVQQAAHLMRSGKPVEAAAILEKALKADPRRMDARLALAKLELSRGRRDVAKQHIDSARAIDPDDPDLNLTEGNLSLATGDISAAREQVERSLSKRPDNVDAIALRGIILAKLEVFDEAEQMFRKVIEKLPQHPEAHMNLGRLYFANARPRDAIGCFQRALQINPKYQQAMFNLSLGLFQLGDLAGGFRAFEARRTLPGPPPSALSTPRWIGDSLEGKSILLRSEQGFGDVIQFVRYASVFKARGARVVLECHPELSRLMQSVNGVDDVISPNSSPLVYDYYLPLMSCPFVLGTQLNSIPAEIPYISADAERSAAYRKKLDALGVKKNIGVAWAGRPTHPNDAHRSTTLKQLAPLGKIPGVRIVSLQKGEAASQTKGSGIAGLVDAAKGLRDFHETAALIGALDLVICVDTAPAHLAGAMGKPVWVMLPRVPDWRWMYERTDSPWYPTMKLYRQQANHQWDDVVARIGEELKAFVAVG